MAARKTKRNLEGQFCDIADEALDDAEMVECDLREYVWGLGLMKAAIAKRLADAQDELDTLAP